MNAPQPRAAAAGGFLGKLLPWLLLDVLGMGLMFAGLLPLAGISLPGLPAGESGSLPWLLCTGGLLLVIAAGVGIVVNMRHLARRATGQAGPRIKK